jgi:predicted amidohydrolase
MPLTIAGVQSDTVWEDPPANFARLRPRIETAVTAGADLVLLPEMFACGFSMDTERTGEPADGPSTTFLIDTAAQTGAWVGGSLPEVADGADRPTNTFVLAGPDGTTHRYAKIHPFTYADEHEHFAAGDQLVTVTIRGVRCSLFVCYDLRFADEFWQVAADTDCYLVPANWPTPRRRHWTALLRARAIENQAYVVGVNRVGLGRRLDGGDLPYAGDSMIIDPLGRVLASAAEVETTLHAPIDEKVVADVRAAFPFQQDRR